MTSEWTVLGVAGSPWVFELLTDQILVYGNYPLKKVETTLTLFDGSMTRIDKE